MCECAFCTFPDKATAAAEMARVLRPGGRVGITDVALDPTRLDAELQMVTQIDGRLRAIRLAKVPALESIDFDTALERVAAAERAVREEIAGYSLLVATKG